VKAHYRQQGYLIGDLSAEATMKAMKISYRACASDVPTALTAILDPFARLAAVASVYEIKLLRCIFRHKSTYAARPLLGTGGMQRHDRTPDPRLGKMLRHPPLLALAAVKGKEHIRCCALTGSCFGTVRRLACVVCARRCGATVAADARRLTSFADFHFRISLETSHELGRDHFIIFSIK